MHGPSEEIICWYRFKKSLLNRLQSDADDTDLRESSLVFDFELCTAIIFIMYGSNHNAEPQPINAHRTALLCIRIINPIKLQVINREAI